MPSAPPFSGQAPLPTPSQQPHPVFTQQRTPRIPLPPPDPSQQRLNTPFKRRIGLATLASCSTGIFLGTSHGAQTAALRFRAENSHRLPTTKRGWYLYHKSKNYYVTKESLKEGLRMARKLGFWTGLYFVTEEVIDRGRVGRAYLAGDVDAKGAKERRRKDVGSSVTAGLVTSAGFSAWNRLPWTTTARMARVGFVGGLIYGLSQDGMTLLQGQRLGYTDWLLNLTGLNKQEAG